MICITVLSDMFVVRSMGHGPWNYTLLCALPGHALLRYLGTLDMYPKTFLTTSHKPLFGVKTVIRSVSFLLCLLFWPCNISISQSVGNFRIFCICFFPFQSRSSDFYSRLFFPCGVSRDSILPRSLPERVDIQATVAKPQPGSRIPGKPLWKTTA